jgi:hypothetical protein
LKPVTYNKDRQFKTEASCLENKECKWSACLTAAGRRG